MLTRLIFLKINTLNSISQLVVLCMRHRVYPLLVREGCIQDRAVRPCFIIPSITIPHAVFFNIFVCLVLLRLYCKTLQNFHIIARNYLCNSLTLSFTVFYKYKICWHRKKAINYDNAIIILNVTSDWLGQEFCFSSFVNSLNLREY